MNLVYNISKIFPKKIHPLMGENSSFFGGETGIRTLARLASASGFQDRSLQPLGYFSIKLVDPVGLEPTTNRL